ncbi:galectin-4 [Pantherophis guttatus]|uniref:Galectin n=1 Tax=Pantherophis guttatus TaxID=94885 RepID=A0A6P9DC90_PANGU|nr:galectin-4 [Pantherophis guttatus]
MESKKEVNPSTPQDRSKEEITMLFMFNNTTCAFKKKRKWNLARLNLLPPPFGELGGVSLRCFSRDFLRWGSSPLFTDPLPWHGSSVTRWTWPMSLSYLVQDMLSYQSSGLSFVRTGGLVPPALCSTLPSLFYKSNRYSCFASDLGTESGPAARNRISMTYFPAPGYMPVYNPTLPYHQPVPGGLRPGMSVYVQGTVPKHTKRFRVNFACGQHEGVDIPFHFNPRFDGRDKTVLNTFQSGRWGHEEIHKMPFRKGEHFEIIFIINDVGYQILVNRNPFCTYGHRMPPQSVQVVSADGDLELQSLTVMGGQMMGNMDMMPNPAYGPPQNLPMMQSPAVYHPTVPYIGNISGGLGAKRTIVVRGSIPMNSNRFHIDLTAGQDIALHINPRMQERTVVRNSFLNGSWGPEERELPFNPFQPGQYFELSIRCGNHRFKVYVNGQPFFNYAHRYRNFPQINTLQMDGDVVLSYIQC